MSEVNIKYVQEAVNYRKKTVKPVWLKFGAAAACLCLLAAGGVWMARNSSNAAPNPSLVQVTNPIITVQSAAKMEEYLDFKVPVLHKEAAVYSVLIVDSYPTMGQIKYADGSTFRMQYGNGDISGIQNGILERTAEFEGIRIEYYKYENMTYAIWEQKGFAFSYIYNGDSVADVESIIRLFK